MGWLGLKEALLHLVFPHVCAGCGGDSLDGEQLLCLACLARLPVTSFGSYPDNPVEKIFWGRLPVSEATAHYYFTKDSILQHLLHELKYRGHRELGLFLGRQMGRGLAEAPRFNAIDALVPMPLFDTRERERGYNQSFLLCQGMADVLQKPVWTDRLVRTAHTESQTRKGRVERWRNMEGRFSLAEGHGLEGRHVLLVDDVVTTGATLEAAGRTLLEAPGLRLGVAALCFAGP